MGTEQPNCCGQACLTRFCPRCGKKSETVVSDILDYVKEISQKLRARIRANEKYLSEQTDNWAELPQNSKLFFEKNARHLMSFQDRIERYDRWVEFLQELERVPEDD